MKAFRGVSCHDHMSPELQLMVKCVVLVILFSVVQLSAKPYNVMFIGVDDLRPQLRSYGHEQMKTPNFDRVAEMGLQFNRAYVQQAVCAASRASLLTGCRPDSTGVDYPYTPWFKKTFIKKYKSIVSHFTEQGFYTRTLGKIHHGLTEKGSSEKHYQPQPQAFVLPENQHQGPKKRWLHLVEPWNTPTLPTTATRTAK